MKVINLLLILNIFINYEAMQNNTLSSIQEKLYPENIFTNEYAQSIVIYPVICIENASIELLEICCILFNNLGAKITLNGNTKKERDVEYSIYRNIIYNNNFESVIFTINQFLNLNKNEKIAFMEDIIRKNKNIYTLYKKELNTKMLLIFDPKIRFNVIIDNKSLNFLSQMTKEYNLTNNNDFTIRVKTSYLNSNPSLKDYKFYEGIDYKDKSNEEYQNKITIIEKRIQEYFPASKVKFSNEINFTNVKLINFKSLIQNN